MGTSDRLNKVMSVLSNTEPWRLTCQLTCKSWQDISIGTPPILLEATYLMRVEVWVEYDDSICGPQIDTDTSCSSTKDVYEDIRIRLVELVHVLLTVSLLRVAILHRLLACVDSALN